MRPSWESFAEFIPLEPADRSSSSKQRILVRESFTVNKMIEWADFKSTTVLICSWDGEFRNIYYIRNDVQEAGSFYTVLKIRLMNVP